MYNPYGGGGRYRSSRYAPSMRTSMSYDTGYFGDDDLMPSLSDSPYDYGTLSDEDDLFGLRDYPPMYPGDRLNRPGSMSRNQDMLGDPNDPNIRIDDFDDPRLLDYLSFIDSELYAEHGRRMPSTIKASLFCYFLVDGHMQMGLPGESLEMVYSCYSDNPMECLNRLIEVIYDENYDGRMEPRRGQRRGPGSFPGGQRSGRRSGRRRVGDMPSDIGRPMEDFSGRGRGRSPGGPSDGFGPGPGSNRRTSRHGRASGGADRMGGVESSIEGDLRSDSDGGVALPRSGGRGRRVGSGRRRGQYSLGHDDDSA